jgi:hypothetical protein
MMVHLVNILVAQKVFNRVLFFLFIYLFFFLRIEREMRRVFENTFASFRFLCPPDHPSSLPDTYRYYIH